MVHDETLGKGDMERTTGGGGRGILDQQMVKYVNIIDDDDKEEEQEVCQVKGRGVISGSFIYYCSTYSQ